ncbi:TAXI family TRAP transporter solute-binding subunit [Mangrovicoccus sp. HB161399]|uniref:TAXI family TRAP transporter solute-binding subunit n=1 Tax=Mangrovicoccus sp. HB161399 TaxID=2720392 RepID=UPI00155349BB|nr:TAXI family TRAP transporter solute-binding subunit [Mangrovicoccus sp. HB161399]
MKRPIFAAAALAALALAPAARAETKLKLATIEPSLGQAITMATFANVVNANDDDVEIEVAGGGAATLHQLEAARGNLDMYMVTPTIYDFISKGTAMYANQPDAAEAAKNLALIMWFPYGQYHYAVRGDSDIELLDDLEGATVFLGPAGGGAYNAAAGWIEATTGLVAGEDYETITANWATGFQSFLDGKIDMYVNGCIDPCQQFIQFAETESLRFIGPESHEGQAVTDYLGDYRYLSEVPADMYGSQVNDGPVMSTDTAVGIGIRADVGEDTVYKITKAFWENVGSISSEAPWAKALSIGYAVQSLAGMPLHPGAARYYREAGVLK